jgi:hypothetical protein
MKAAQLEVAIQAAAGFDFLEKLDLNSFVIGTDERTLKMSFFLDAFGPTEPSQLWATGRVTGKGLQSSYGKDKIFVGTV